jgi:hypothetical protein
VGEAQQVGGPVHEAHQVGGRVMTSVATATKPDAKTSDSDGHEMASDGAAEFMARVVPWPRDGTPGYVNLHWRTRSLRDPEKYYWSGKPTKNVDDFLNMTKWALKKPPIKDIYFCLSLQSQIEKTSGGKIVSARSKANALLLKAIWLDVDIKEAPRAVCFFN